MELTAEQWHDLKDDADFHRRGTVVRGDEWNYAFLAWNQRPVPDAPFFKDGRVRRAMSLAFPHKEFLEKVCFGLYRPAPCLFHPDTWMADPAVKPLEQDLEAAGRLLKEAGWADSDGDTVLDREIDGKRVPFRAPNRWSR
jgi:peptide/nickel transport system substrate-binding protein